MVLLTEFFFNSDRIEKSRFENNQKDILMYHIKNPQPEQKFFDNRKNNWSFSFERHNIRLIF